MSYGDDDDDEVDDGDEDDDEEGLRQAAVRLCADLSKVNLT